MKIRSQRVNFSAFNGETYYGILLHARHGMRRVIYTIPGLGTAEALLTRKEARLRCIPLEPVQGR